MAETAEVPQDVVTDENKLQDGVEDATEKNGTAANGANDDSTTESAKVVNNDDDDGKADEKVEQDGEENTTKAVKDDAPKSKTSDGKRKEPLSPSQDRADYKRTRGPPRKDNRNRAVFDEQPESNDADEIRRQVEFYFSDSNLPIDAFLLEQTGGHANNPVPLKVIHQFKRMRHFQPYSAVRDAVKESRFLNLSDNDDEITRKEPLDAKFTDDVAVNKELLLTNSMSRSIYAKGFGEEESNTHLDIETFFAPYGPLKSVRLRRHSDGQFKGSVFVEFVDDKTQKHFLELDPKPQWNEKDLSIMSKQKYCDDKNEAIKNGDVKPNSPDRNRHFRDNRRGGGGHRGGRGDRKGNSKEWIDKDDWKSRRDRDQHGDRRGRSRGRGGHRHNNNRGGRDQRRRSRSPASEHNSKRDHEEKAKNDPPSRTDAEAQREKSNGDAAPEKTKEAVPTES